MSEDKIIQISDQIAIRADEITFDFIRSSGPGGQHVNKTASAVQLRFDITRSSSLPEPVRRRLIRLAGKRLSNDQILVIEAKRFRSQEANRRDAIERLIRLVQKALIPPKPRKQTQPSRKSIERRLQHKKAMSMKKQLRKALNDNEE